MDFIEEIPITSQWICELKVNLFFYGWNFLMIGMCVFPYEFIVKSITYGCMIRLSIAKLL